MLILCLSALLVRSVLRRYALDHGDAWSAFGIGVISFTLLDITCEYANGYGFPPRQIFWSPVLRPFVFLGVDRHTQRFVAEALPALVNSRVVDLIMMQTAFFATWAWFGLVLFAESEEGDAYFSNYVHASRSLFTLFTTANFPDVMMPAYEESRWLFAYFFVFLTVSLYLLFNILLAALFNSYKAHVKTFRCKDQDMRERAFQLAFQILASEKPDTLGRITTQNFVQFWGAYCQTARKCNNECADRIFAAMGETLTGTISYEKHKQLGHLISDTSILLEHELKHLSDRAQRLMTCIRTCVDIFATVSALTTLAQTNDILESANHRPKRYVFVYTLCAATYMLEICIAVLGFGFQGFWARGRRRIDLLMGFAITLLEITRFHTVRKAWLSRTRALVRVLVAERVLWRFRRPRQAWQMIVALLGTYRKAIHALFLVFYLYGTLGVEIFGGLIRVDSAELKGSLYAKSNYYSNNFNDFASALVTLFELMVVNNWFVIAGGLARVAHSPAVAWAFCISFYFCIHTLILNVLVTSVVASYEHFHETMPEDSVCRNYALLATADEEALLLDEKTEGENEIDEVLDSIKASDSTNASQAKMQKGTAVLQL